MLNAEQEPRQYESIRELFTILLYVQMINPKKIAALEIIFVGLVANAKTDLQSTVCKDLVLSRLSN